MDLLGLVYVIIVRLNINLNFCLRLKLNQKTGKQNEPFYIRIMSN